LIKKIDIFIIISILACCFILSIFSYAKPFEGEPVVNVYIDGKKYDSLKLSEDIEVPIKTSYGFNNLSIKDNIAKIDDSDCNTKSCISKGGINRPGSIIVCAPHHLVIKIETINQGTNP
jgi:hypothetical protein